MLNIWYLSLSDLSPRMVTQANGSGIMMDPRDDHTKYFSFQNLPHSLLQSDITTYSSNKDVGGHRELKREGSQTLRKESGALFFSLVWEAKSFAEQ